MYVKEIKAEPNASGGQIDLSWKNPSKDEFPNFKGVKFKGVKIVRRGRRFPEAFPPQFSDTINDFLYDGTLVYNGTEESFSDKELHGETVYYYTFYTYDDNADPTKVRHFTNRASRVAAMATSNYGMGGKLNELIPAIYKRYDTIYAEPGTVAPEDEQKGELQRFMEILGGQLDLIGSFVAGTRKFLDLDQCDGSLLPLLAQWIGWQTNPSLDINSQRNEIRYAPELYKTVGIVANLRAFVNRLINWDCQVKEFVHNVFVSNEPEQLNIWSQKLVNGNWCDAELVSLNFAYSGAPSSFVDSNRRLWLFYHTKREGNRDIYRKKRIDQWDIWYKIFDQGKWSPGYRVTRSETIDKYPSALQASSGNVWLFYSSHDSSTWNIKTKILAVGGDATRAQLISQRGEPFTLTDGSTLVISVDGAIETVVTFRSADFINIGNATCAEVVVALNRYVPSLTASEETGKIHLASNTVGEGSSLIIDIDASTAASSLGFGAGFPNVLQSDMEPAAFEDDTEHIWLFWSSHREGNWDIWYNKFDGISWGTEQRLTSDLTADREPAGVFFDAADPNRKFWVFWSRKGPEGWNIFYRTKPDTNLDDLTWNPEKQLSPIPPGQEYDNREPAVRLDNQGNILVFWSSNRTGSWNIWYKTFDKALNNWTAEAPATTGHFTKKAPTVLEGGEGGIRLLFRSNESIAYSSKFYPGTTTIDSRYSGSTAIDVRNRERIGGHGKLEDILHYTYDTGKKNDDYWYARDTIGIYLTPDTEDQQLITRSHELVKGILNRFLPIQLRAVFIINPAVYRELVYTYDFPIEKTQRFIDEQFFDSTITEVYPGLSDSYKDRVPGWIWLRSWSEEYLDHHAVDFITTPIDTKFRTWHIGLESGGYNPWKS
jgi:phage tail-like protein